MDEKVLTRELINLFNKEQAHVSLENSLKDLKPENRAKKPKEGLHSVWDELEHIRITQEDILQYMINPEWKSPSWPDEYWPDDRDSVPDEEWNKSVKQCISDRNEMVNIIKDRGAEITDSIPHAKVHTYLREMLVAAQHNSYHIAQIALIRKMLGNWR